MAANLPNRVRLQVRDAIYKKADDFCYMHKSRIESGVFMENLVKDPEVGKIIGEYLPKDAIKTYIKDAVLNRYMKEKKKGSLPSDPALLLPVIQKVYSQDADLIHAEHVFLFRLEKGDLLLISQGTLVKWETALRKALEFIARSPGLPPQDGRLHTLLNIAVMGSPFTEADKNHLASALGHVGVTLNIADK